MLAALRQAAPPASALCVRASTAIASGPLLSPCPQVALKFEHNTSKGCTPSGPPYEWTVYK